MALAASQPEAFLKASWSSAARMIVCSEDGSLGPGPADTPSPGLPSSAHLLCNHGPR